MRNLEPRSERYRHLEPLLAAVIVLLKLHVLYDTWGRIQGYDCFAMLEMFHATRWLDPLPPSFALFSSYHPPLSFLIMRPLYALYPHDIEVSQISSTIALLIAFLAFRHVLRLLGWLWTLPGLCLLYGGLSIPLLVSLGVETTHDSWVLAWFMLVLATSTSLFWLQALPKWSWWKDNRLARRVVLLGLILAASLLNKFSGLLAFGVPFVIIGVRRGLKATLREAIAPALAVLLAVVVVFPYYYKHNYKATGHWMPSNAEFFHNEELVFARSQRDTGSGIRFIGQMLRYPLDGPSDPREPVLDSFTHSFWLHTWVRDVVLGDQASLSLVLGRLYSRVFALLMLAGSIFFVVRRRTIPTTWRDLGWVILLIAAYHCLSALLHAWRYPIWVMRVFKAKYLSPAVLWVPYAATVVFSDEGLVGRRRWLLWAEDLGFYALVAFVAFNHLLPVY